MDNITGIQNTSVVFITSKRSPLKKKTQVSIIEQYNYFSTIRTVLKVTIIRPSAKRCRGNAITSNIGAKQAPSLHFENMIEQCKPTEIRFWLLCTGTGHPKPMADAHGFEL